MSLNAASKDEDVFVNWKNISISFNAQLDVTLCGESVCQQQHGSPQRVGFESVAIMHAATLFAPPAVVLLRWSHRQRPVPYFADRRQKPTDQRQICIRSALANCHFDHHVWTVPRCDPRARRCLADAWKVILNVWSCRPRVRKGSSQEGEMEEHRSSTSVSFLFFLDQTTWTTCCLRTSEGKQSCPAAHGVTSFPVSIFKFGDQTNPLGESCSVNCTATSQLWEVNKLKNSLPSSVKVAHTALWTHLKGKLSLLRSFS